MTSRNDPGIGAHERLANQLGPDLETGPAPNPAQLLADLSPGAVALNQVNTIVATLAGIYGLAFTMGPLDEADSDTRRAVSEFAPLVTETSDKRWVFTEVGTLRVYADAIGEAVSWVPGIEVVSDTRDYDTRAGDLDSDDWATCFAFQVEGQAGNPIHVVSLSTTQAFRDGTLAWWTGRRDSVIDQHSGVTVGEQLDRDAAKAAVVFKRSRAEYTQDRP